MVRGEKNALYIGVHSGVGEVLLMIEQMPFFEELEITNGSLNKFQMKKLFVPWLSIWGEIKILTLWLTPAQISWLYNLKGKVNLDELYIGDIGSDAYYDERQSLCLESLLFNSKYCKVCVELYHR